MKHSVLTFITGIILSTWVFVSVSSCKEDTILNASLVPVGDTINTVVIPDTLTILSRTFFDDTLVTSLSISGIPIYHALGSLSATADPYSGKTNASFYFQIIPPALNYTFPATPDSAVLILPYGYFTWGDTSSIIPQTFNVYEVTDTLTKDTTYYSNTEKAVDKTNLLGSVTISSYATLKDSVNVAGINRAPHIRIKMSSTFINKIKDGATAGDHFGAYSDFMKWFKGLYIEPANSGSGNALFYFRLDGSDDYTRAGVVFYYTEDTAVKTASFPFDMSYAAHYNKVKRDYTGTPTGALMASANTSDSVFIVQNEPGAVADLRFPFLKNLPKQPINKAELVITQLSLAGDQAAVYFPMERLYPVGVNTDGSTYTVLDRYPTSDSEPLIFMDGKRKTVTIGAITVSQYTLNLPREIQRAIVEQRDTLHLRISGASSFPGAYRLIGAGRNASNSSIRVKLNIVYSKII